MSTVLRLPHMDIVLECDNKVRNTGTKRLAHAKMDSPRRSGRLRNVSGVNQDHMQQTKNNVRSKRRRYNSVMDDQEGNDDLEENDERDTNGHDTDTNTGEAGDKRRQEPEHRHLNRMKMQRQKVMISTYF